METNNYSNIVMKILRQHILFDIMIRRRLLKKAHNLANILGSFGNIQIQKVLMGTHLKDTVPTLHLPLMHLQHTHVHIGQAIFS